MRIGIKVYIKGKTVWDNPVTCRIEVRDVSLMDTPAKILTVHEALITEASELNPYLAEIEVPDNPGNRSLVIWSHISVNGSHRIMKGDYITTASFPITGFKPDYPIVVRLNPV